MLIIPLFTADKMCKQSECLAKEEWMNKMSDIYRQWNIFHT